MRNLISIAIVLLCCARVLEAAAMDERCNLAGKRFRSVGKGETGLAPNHTVSTGFWTIEFKSGYLDWDHSDVSEALNFTCSEGNLSSVKSQGSLRKDTLKGTYDPTTQILRWDGRDYKEYK